MECAKPQIYFSWISSNVNPKLKISDQGNSLTSLSSIGPFKSAYGNYPLLPNGIYYWEIQIKKGSFFKIGIADHTKFKPDFTGAFSDTDFGYAFYSLNSVLINFNYCREYFTFMNIHKLPFDYHFK